MGLRRKNSHGCRHVRPRKIVDYKEKWFWAAPHRGRHVDYRLGSCRGCCSAMESWLEQYEVVNYPLVASTLLYMSLLLYTGRQPIIAFFMSSPASWLDNEETIYFLFQDCHFTSSVSVAYFVVLKGSRVCWLFPSSSATH